jgi:dipeptidase D
LVSLSFSQETPRPSNTEGSTAELALITQKLLDFGAAHKLDCARDAAGNIRLRKPATKGYEQATKIVLQSHIDVVCSKSNDKIHDFTKDPVTPIIEGNIMRADRTTLGADDGIGVAASMALLELSETDKDFVHGPLEAVFTVDEETTMGGAENIGKELLQSEVMINIDSEEASSICVGCAGGFEKKLTLPVHRTSLAGSGLVGIKLHLHSLLGGHTGIDIHKGRGNALIIAARMLAGASSAQPRLISLTGGSAPNAIPRETTIEVALLPAAVQKFKDAIGSVFERVKKEYAAIERVVVDAAAAEPVYRSSMQLDITELPSLDNRVATSVEETKKILNLALNVPHGPLKVNLDLEYAVETSISFSLISLPPQPEGNGGAGDGCTIHIFSRSSFDQDMQDVDARLVALAEMSGCTYTPAFNKFPGWDPKLDSPALKQVIDTHQRITGKAARVYSVHAGLECGLFKLSVVNQPCSRHQFQRTHRSRDLARTHERPHVRTRRRSQAKAARSDVPTFSVCVSSLFVQCVPGSGLRVDRPDDRARSLAAGADPDRHRRAVLRVAQAERRRHQQGLAQPSGEEVRIPQLQRRRGTRREDEGRRGRSRSIAFAHTALCSIVIIQSACG